MGRRDACEFPGEEDAEDALIKCGKQLSGPLKSSKDGVVKQLKAASKVLEDAPQNSGRLQRASREMCQALARPELLKHKDKEVRLYVAVCAIHTLRLHAPDSPYNDPQLEAIFQLAIDAFAEVAEPSAPHFRLCLSLLEVAAHVKCCLLMLDLDAGPALVVHLFTRLLDAVNADNRALVEAPALELLASLLEESDDVPQPLLDAVLAPLLPAARGDNAARHALARALLQRAQAALQPHVQRFLTRLLDGARTDSELAGDAGDIILEVYHAAPQVTLPVLPHIEPGLLAIGDAQRLQSVNLLCNLLTHGGGAPLLGDYPHLFDALLRRLGDKSADVRRRVLDAAKGLADSCAGEGERRGVADAVAQRLLDPEEKLRSAAAAALCAIAANHPGAVRSANFVLLTNRLRDKRAGVRKDVAAQVARLVRVWCTRLEGGGGGAGGLPKQKAVLELAVGLCNLSLTKDSDLAPYIMNDLFRGGIFPAKLPPASAARWYGALWRAAGAQRRAGLCSLLSGKCGLQSRVRELLRLRTAAREQKAVSGLAASSAAGSGGAAVAAAAAGDGGSTPSQQSQPPQPQPRSPNATAAQQLEQRLRALAAGLHGVHKAEEGLAKLWAMKDNHIFRGLAALSTYGTSYAEAAETAKDVQQRVGAKGPAADVAAALTARLLPNLVSPEVLRASLAAAGDSQEAQALVLDVAAAAPQLLAQSLPAAAAACMADDPLAAECGARVLAAAGRHMRAAGGELSAQLQARLEGMALKGGPPAAKAAVRALVVMLGADAAMGPLRHLCSELLAKLRRRETLRSHAAVVAALKALAQVGRLLPALLAEHVEALHSVVVDHILPHDMSSGRPLLHERSAGGSDGEEPDSGLSWGRPSADVAVKAAALKALAQALVPDDPKATVPGPTAAVAAQLIARLEALTDPDPRSEAFAAFRCRLPEPLELQRKKRRLERAAEAGRKGNGSGGRKRKAGEADDDASGSDDGGQAGSGSSGSQGSGGSDLADWDDMDGAAREAAAAASAAQSADAGWVRLAASSALLRLCRAYDSSMTGDNYVNLGLACQDALPDARRALLGKIERGVGACQRRGAGPQRAAKLAALFALYGADPHPPNARDAHTLLVQYVAERRKDVEGLAAKVAAAGGDGGGSLINAMPEFILPFLVFLVANHPDYDRQTAWEAPGGGEAGGEGGAPRSPAALVVGRMFQRMLQLALEALLLPAGPGGADATETVLLLPSSLKFLRRLKFCDLLSLADREAVDEEATAAAHQICDVAICVAKELAVRANGGLGVAEGRVPGGLSLPRLCFRPRNNLQAEDKRGDGSDLPRGFRLQLDPPFGGGHGSPGGARRPGAPARIKPGAKPADEEVEQQQQQQQQMPEQRQQSAAAATASGAAGPDPLASPRSGRKRPRPAGGGDAPQRAAAAKRRAKPAPAARPAAHPANPVRQQPRRGAKDAAGAKLRGDAAGGAEGDGWADDDDGGSSSDGEGVARPAAAPRTKPAARDLRAHTSDEESSGAAAADGHRENEGDSPSTQQENGDNGGRAAAALKRSGGKPAAKLDKQAAPELAALRSRRARR